MRSEVALAAVAAGARIVNDVSGGLADPRMHEVVAASGAAYVAMHWRAHSDTMQQHASYDGPGGVVAAVRDELAERVEAMLAAGIGRGPDRAGPRASASPRTPSTTGPSSGARPDRRPRLPGAGRRVPQVVPREPAGRPGRGGPRGRGARARQLGAARPARPGRRLGAAHARRPGRARRAARPGPLEPDPIRTEATDDRRARPSPGSSATATTASSSTRSARGSRSWSISRWASTPGPAAASDDLRDTVDYGSLVAAVKAAVEADPVDLIETLAQRLADVCLRDARVEWARITVHKPDAPIEATFGDVTLTITRERPSS